MTSTCTYKNCFSQRHSHSQLTFFRLPTKNLAQRRKWIVNSGNERLFNISHQASRFFCEKHFLEKDLRRQFHRTTLSRDAVPIPYETQQINVSSSSQLEEENVFRLSAAKLEEDSNTIVVQMNDEEQIEIVGLSKTEILVSSVEEATSVIDRPLKRFRNHESFDVCEVEKVRPEMKDQSIQATPEYQDFSNQTQIISIGLEDTSCTQKINVKKSAWRLETTKMHTGKN